ncbi:SDR family NAD(P)-dependent oxidoreductase [Leptospira stimsonii]|uniref:SDR family NAD(P)-dependent oxidoreductase n=1 Tax=Leptospira stimsonii TaxID=2202203 RepID=A0ABY2NAS9_9LEPT|nr:SDR family NAD(P)-dependent oxidoreductase [Leptospira stimsonii]TGK23109.1 SDR family NAD(P)-dependent oxidoreductase [Leptospira stimsonii]TGM20193.1 SDR family NAD(P)-dependent oxidoreductase [Leptospira stimsonii]
MNTLKYPKLLKFMPNKTAFITGAGSGLGRAMAEELADDGWSLILTDIKNEGLQELQNVLRSKGVKLEAFYFDVTDEKQFEKNFQSAISKFGSVELLVNNAGLGAGGNLSYFEVSEWRRVFEVNVIGIAIGIRTVLPQMLKRKCGHILNIASAAAYHSLPYIGAYNATKAAVVSITESLNGELSNTGVSCSVMISGFFKSSLSENTIGGERAIKLTEGLMKLSSFDSKDVAIRTLKNLEARRFYSIIGLQARIFYFIKRYFPNLLLFLAPKVAERGFEKALLVESKR